MSSEARTPETHRPAFLGPLWFLGLAVPEPEPEAPPAEVDEGGEA